MKTRILVLVAGLAAGCGQKEPDGRETISGLFDNEEIYENEEAMEEQSAFEGIEEATEMAETSTESEEFGNESSLALTSGDRIRNLIARVRSRNCTEQESDTLVTTEGGRIRGGFAINANGAIRGGRLAGLDISRRWSQNEQPVPCNAEKTAVVIDWQNVGGLQMQSEFQKGVLKNASVHSQAEQVAASEGRILAKGKREVDFAAKAAEDGQIGISKTIKSEVIRTLKYRNGENLVQSGSLVIKTDEEAPLVVDVIRDGETLEVEERTLVSGTLVVEFGNGRKRTLSYENFKFGYAEESCLIPLSGSMSGAAYDKDGGLKKSFTATAENGTVTFTDSEGNSRSKSFSCNKELEAEEAQSGESDTTL